MVLIIAKYILEVLSNLLKIDELRMFVILIPEGILNICLHVAQDVNYSIPLEFLPLSCLAINISHYGVLVFDLT
jgi:hypothetical protein